MEVAVKEVPGSTLGHRGALKVPPTAARRGLSLAEWVRRLANRQPLLPFGTNRPSVIVHLYHHY